MRAAASCTAACIGMFVTTSAEIRRRLEHRHAAAGQDAQGAREARGVEATGQAAEDRQAQQRRMPGSSAAPAASGCAEISQASNADSDRQEDTVVAQEIAETRSGQRVSNGSCAAGVRKDRDDLGYDVYEHATDDQQRQGRQAPPDRSWRSVFSGAVPGGSPCSRPAAPARHRGGRTARPPPRLRDRAQGRLSGNRPGHPPACALP